MDGEIGARLKAMEDRQNDRHAQLLAAIERVQNTANKSDVAVARLTTDGTLAAHRIQQLEADLNKGLAALRREAHDREARRELENNSKQEYLKWLIPTLIALASLAYTIWQGLA